MTQGIKMRQLPTFCVASLMLSSVLASQTNAQVGMAPRHEVYGPTVDADDTTATISWGPAPNFVPDDLAELQERISRTDPSINAAAMARLAARAEVSGARWARFPSVGVGFGVENGANRFTPTFEVSTPIWAGGTLAGNLRRSKEVLSSRNAALEEVALALAVEVNALYYQYKNSTALLGIYQESLEDHAELVQTMERRVSREVSPLADLELARSRYAQVEQEMSAVLSQQLTALELLRELAADPDLEIGGPILYEAQEQSVDWFDASSSAVEYSPTLRRLLYSANAAFAEKSIARGALLPRISAYYRYNETTGGSVGLGTTIQTGNGLSQFSAIEAADARARQVQNDGELAARQLRQDIQSTLTNLEAARRRAEISISATQNAARVSESYKRQFITGRRSWLDLMNALREDLGARLSQQQAENTTMLLNARLALLTGRWRLSANNGG